MFIVDNTFANHLCTQPVCNTTWAVHALRSDQKYISRFGGVWGGGIENMELLKHRCYGSITLDILRKS